jgi:N4-gp56 family major capsid protein
VALTTTSTLTQTFVDRLSREMTLEPDPEFVFARLAGGARAGAMNLPDIMGRAGLPSNLQAAMNAGLGNVDPLNAKFMQVAASFVNVVWQPGTGPGLVIKVDQPRYLGGTMTEAARTLTEGARVTANPQAAVMGQVALTIKELGGPHDSTSIAPIGLTDLLKRRAEHDLVEYVGLLLRRDRNAVLDRILIDKLLTTTNQTIGSGGAGGATTGTMTAGGNRLTDEDLAAIKRKLMERNIPKFPTGLYGLVIGPRHEEDLRADPNFREIARYLAASPGNILMAGHIADYGGFHIVVSNNIPTVAVGGGGAVTGFQSLAFGPGGLGWAIGMDAEARRDRNDDFGREDRYLWLAHEAFALLDADFVEKIVTS